MIKIQRTKLGGKANSELKMEPEDLVKDGQSNAAGKHPLTDYLPGRNITLLWKAGRSRSLAERKEFSHHIYTLGKGLVSYRSVPRQGLTLMSKNMLSHKVVSN